MYCRPDYKYNPTTGIIKFYRNKPCIDCQFQDATTGKRCKKYRIKKNKFYTSKDKEAKIMYNRDMVWRHPFMSIAQQLVMGQCQTVGPICIGEYTETDIIPTSSLLSGSILSDSLTGINFVVFSRNNTGPVINDVDFPFLLVNMYPSAADYILSYEATPIDNSKPVKVSFYTLTDIYNFKKSRFWLLLDRDSHFTTYIKRKHTFQMPTINNWICTTENVLSISLSIKAIPYTHTQFCTSTCIITYAADRKVLIGKAEVINTNVIPDKEVVINFSCDLLYSVYRMRDYLYRNSLGLLLPVIPLPSVAPLATITKIYNVETYYNSFLGNYYSTTNNLPDEDRTDKWSTNWWAINTTNIASTAQSIAVSWDIAVIPVSSFMDNTTVWVELEYQYGGLWYYHRTITGQLAAVEFQLLSSTTRLADTLYLPNDATDIIMLVSGMPSSRSIVIGSITVTKL